MAIDQQLRDRIKVAAKELRQDLWGPKGYPAWGTKFTEMEDKTADVGDALACELLSLGLEEQAEVEGHVAGKCSGCGEPIPIEQIAGRLGLSQILCQSPRVRYLLVSSGIRSSNRMAKWFNASFQCRIGIVQRFDASRIAM